MELFRASEPLVFWHFEHGGGFTGEKLDFLKLLKPEICFPFPYFQSYQ